jgi:hypothetical protein
LADLLKKNKDKKKEDPKKPGPKKTISGSTPHKIIINPILNRIAEGADEHICLGAAYCPKPHLCKNPNVGCMREPSPAPIKRLNEPRPATHFVGFRGEEYHSAVKTYGKPDFIHRDWDHRATADVGPHDTVVFAKDYKYPVKYTHDDSNQPNDPAAKERLTINNKPKKKIVEIRDDEHLLAVIKKVFEDIENVESNTLQYHEELNHALWDGTVLKPEVRQVLLNIAHAFIKSWHHDEIQVVDITFTGSNANYNWTQYSDIDLHIIYDAYSTISPELVADLLREKNGNFKKSHTLQVKGFPVELYPQKVGEPLVAGAVYSLILNQWQRFPEKKPPVRDQADVHMKTKAMVAEIEDALNGSDLEAVEAARKKIYQVRQAGLETSGEMGVENTVFKILRNAGYIQNLRDWEHNYESKSLALEHRKSLVSGDYNDIFFLESDAGEPKKTVTAYKLFNTKKDRPGELFPLFIGKNKSVPVGRWMTADHIPTKGYAERPGWHSGALPTAPHLRTKGNQIAPNRVWAEVHMPADVDHQAAADASKTHDIRDRVPAGGHYRFKTNKMQGGAWIIGGSMKVHKVLSDHEVHRILTTAGEHDAATKEVHDPSKFVRKLREKIEQEHVLGTSPDELKKHSADSDALARMSDSAHEVGMNQLHGKRGPILGRDQTEAVQRWTTPEYREINNHLRGTDHSKRAAKVAGHLQSAILDHSLEHSVHAYRGVHGPQAESLNKLNSGDKFSYPGFHAMTIDPKRATHFAKGEDMIHTVVPKGHPALYSSHPEINSWTQERELTLPHHSSFKYLGHEQIDMPEYHYTGTPTGRNRSIRLHHVEVMPHEHHDEESIMENEENDHITLYHGTSDASAKALIKNGWKPNKWHQGGNMGQTKHLYATTDPEDARWFANEKGHNSIVRIRAPKTHLIPDPEDAIGETIDDELEKNKHMGLPAKLALHRSLEAAHFSLHEPEKK